MQTALSKYALDNDQYPSIITNLIATKKNVLPLMSEMDVAVNTT